MYEFSFISFLIGAVLIIPSILFVRYYSKVSDFLGAPMSKTQIASFICVGIAFLVMFNIPAFIGNWLVQAFFSKSL